MRTMMKSLIISMMLMSVISCVHRPFVVEYYFQAMGEPQEIVMTVDMSRHETLTGSMISSDPSFSALLSRVNRLSVALYDTKGTTSEDGILSLQDLSTYAYYGAVEGNIPAFLTNSMLLWDDAWDKVEEQSVRYYRNTQLGLDVYAPKRGLLLFASDDYLKAYQRTYRNRTTQIPRGLADRMATSVFGLYVHSPQAMIDVGLAIPKTVLEQTESLMFVIEESLEGELTLGGIITMQNTRLANALSILLKSSYIAEKRRNREPLGDLTNLFILEENAVYINGYPLSEEQYRQFSQLFGSLTSLSAGER